MSLSMRSTSAKYRRWASPLGTPLDGLGPQGDEGSTDSDCRNRRAEVGPAATRDRTSPTALVACR